MNTNKLNELADHLESYGGYFNMNFLDNCALGCAVRHFNKTQESRVLNLEAQQCVTEILGIKLGDSKEIFMFGARWSSEEVRNNPKAAAERIRYVAQHGDCPSVDQWDDFEVFPRKSQIAYVPMSADVALKLVNAEIKEEEVYA